MSDSDSSGHRAAGDGDGFHDYELLEYLLGLATPRRDTKPLARQLLADFGSLPVLLAATPLELKRVDGLSDGPPRHRRIPRHFSSTIATS